jgi:hypothetical protein
MSDPNGWPDPQRPGVPMHPERDGWHWLAVDPGSDPCAFGWWAGNGVWLADDNHPEPADERAPEDMALVWECYLGPCHTPQEVAALVAGARAAGMREAAGIASAPRRSPAMTHADELRALAEEAGDE